MNEKDDKITHLGILSNLENGRKLARFSNSPGTRKAEDRTGVSHADFTCIRNVQLDRFTIDRLMIVLNKLGQHVDVQIDVRPRAAAEETPAHP